MSKKKEETGWGEVFDSLKRNVFGFDKDLDDEDFEEVEKLEAPKPKKPTQKGDEDKTAQVATQNPSEESEEAESEALAAYSGSLQAGQDLDRFFHTAFHLHRQSLLHSPYRQRSSAHVRTFPLSAP